MIADGDELKVAVRNLRILEHALGALRDQLSVSNPDLLAVSTGAYERRIQILRKEIIDFLCVHPDALSLILPPVDVSEGLPLAA